jgi:hypothetical protein
MTECIMAHTSLDAQDAAQHLADQQWQQRLP